MEFLIILTTLISGSLSLPIVRTRTLNELSTAIEKQTDEAMQPYLIDALNKIMYALFSGGGQNVHAIIRSPSGDITWTMDQLEEAVHDPHTKPNYQPYIVRALHQLHYMHEEGNLEDSVEVVVPALDISVWTISDVEEAKKDPHTKPELESFLKKADIQIQEALKQGELKEKVRVTMVTPVGIVPVKNGTIPEIIPRSTNLF